MTRQWVRDVGNVTKEWRELVYNSHSVLRDYRSYDEILSMPIRNLLDEVNFFSPKIKEIAKRQETEQLKAELEGKRNMVKPGGIKG